MSGQVRDVHVRRGRPAPTACGRVNHGATGILLSAPLMWILSQNHRSDVSGVHRAFPRGTIPERLLRSGPDPWLASRSGWPRAIRAIATGWIEGRTVTSSDRWSEGRPERVAEFTAESSWTQKVNVIVTYGGTVATVKQATASISIVFAIAGDPVGSGFVANLRTRAATSLECRLNRTKLPVSTSNSCVMWSLIFAGWQSCLMPTIPQACGRRARFRPRLARWASKSRHTKSGTRRILRPSSEL